MLGPAVVDNEAERRFETTVDDKRTELVYRRNAKRLLLVHTEVPEGLAGRGIGGILVSAAVDKPSETA